MGEENEVTTDERLDQILNRLDAMDKRFDRVDDYLLRFRNEVTARLDVIENRLDTISPLLMGIEQRLQPLTKAVLDFGTVATKLTRDQARLEERVSKLVDPAA